LYLNSPPPPIPGIVITGIIFAFTCMCIHFLQHIHPSALFSQQTVPHKLVPPPHQVFVVCEIFIYFRVANITCFAAESLELLVFALRTMIYLKLI
jgi:hypothetical protein